jgi:tetratricopeptide (TPR) repeat protein
MKNTIAVVLIVMSLFCSTGLAQRSSLSNAGKQGLRATSLEEVLRLPEDQIDLATAVLIASEYWSDVVAGRRYLEQLDDMALEVRKRLLQHRIPFNQQAIPVLNDYLFHELKFTPIPNAKDPNDLFLHSVLDRRQGYCLSLSVLYLSLAERLGLRVYGVVVPGHFFVRYDDGGRVRFNIETTDNGSSVSDEHYIEKFKLPRDYSKTLYMKNLTKRQTLGCFFNNLGSVYSDIGDTDTALRALERAVTINPTLPECRVNLAGIYMRKDRPRDALSQYEIAIRQNPNDPLIHLNLGGACLQLDRPVEAIAAFQRSLELDPNLVLAYRNLAIAFTRQGRYSQAITELEHAVRLDPQNADVHLQLGDVYYQMNDPVRAVTSLTRALSLKPNSPKAYVELGQSYERLGRTAEAIGAYKNAVGLKPTMVEAIQALGNAYFAKKDYDEAAQYFAQAVGLDPNDAWNYFNLGACYSNRNDFANSVKAYDHALKLDPNIGEAHVGSAYGYYVLKQYDLAWEHVVAAQKLNVKVQDDLVQAVRSMLK